MGRILHGGLPVLAVLAIGLAVSACSSLGQVTEAEQQQILATAQAPRLQSGEKIRVTVYNEPSLSGDFQIDPSGFVSLPLAGTLKAGGLTQNELEQALAQKYSSQYLKNPKVTVSVAEYRPFYIIGEVEHPADPARRYHQGAAALLLRARWKTVALC
jgi:protein involved in polysaccharide export with SLBB domain